MNKFNPFYSRVKKLLTFIIVGSLCLQPITTYAASDETGIVKSTESIEYVNETQDILNVSQSISSEDNIEKSENKVTDEVANEEPESEETEGEDKGQPGIDETDKESNEEPESEVTDGEDKGQPGTDETDKESNEEPESEVTDGEDKGQSGTDEADKESNEEPESEVTDGEDKGQPGTDETGKEISEQPESEVTDGEALGQSETEVAAIDGNNKFEENKDENDGSSEGDYPNADLIKGSPEIVNSDNKEVKLSAGQKSALDTLLSMPAAKYNKKLATMCAELSTKAYAEDGSDVVNYLKDYGFDESSIATFNYGKDVSYAYTLAVKDYQGEDSDGNTKILVMDARGSVTNEELAGDIASKPTKDYFGYKVHEIADTFYKKIQENLPNFLQEGVNYKILTTGHSLGGAVANLMAGVMTHEKKADVYCYTFGAIDSIQAPEKGKSATEGFENIHNVYNDVDTFSPSQYGWIMAGGAGSKYGKFGHMDSYSQEHRTEEQQAAGWTDQIRDHVNHLMDNYLLDVKEGRVDCTNKSEDEEDKDDYHEAVDDETASTDTETNDEFKDLDLAEETFMGILDMYWGEIVSAYLTDDTYLDDDIDDLLKLMNGEVLYEANCQALSDEVIVNKVTTLKDDNGKKIVLLNISNKTDKDITIGFDSVIADGKETSIEPWKSTTIPASKSIQISVSLTSLVGDGNDIVLPITVNALATQKPMFTKNITVIDNGK